MHCHPLAIRNKRREKSYVKISLSRIGDIGNVKMLLNDIKIKSIKPTEKSKTYPDGQGLRLLIHANGSKYWQFRYTFESKEKNNGFGTVPRSQFIRGL